MTNNTTRFARFDAVNYQVSSGVVSSECANLVSKRLVIGTFTLTGATPVTVAEPFITVNSAVIITLKTVGGTVGAVPAIQTITASTGFTVAGTAGDTSIYNYMILD